MIVDLAVTVCIDAFQQDLDLLLTKREVVAGQALAQLIRTDRSAVVLIEVGKGGFQVVFLQVVVTLQAGSNELGVVDEAILVGIDHGHGVEDLVLVDVDLGDLVQAILQLLVGQRTVAVLVHLRKCLTQRLDLIFRDTRSDEAESGPLELNRVHVGLHVGEDVLRDLHILELLISLRLEPRVVVGLLSCQSHVGLAVKQGVDKSLGLVRDVAPNLVVVVIRTSEDVVDNLLVGLSAKGRLSAHHDEKDDAH